MNKDSFWNQEMYSAKDCLLSVFVSVAFWETAKSFTRKLEKEKSELKSSNIGK
jgi:hypothetical protein